jgi:hypothetical protein
MPEQELKDKTIKCKDCGTDFVFSAGEQKFFKAKKLANEPKRCKPCRAKKKEQKALDRTEDPGGDMMAEG